MPGPRLAFPPCDTRKRIPVRHRGLLPDDTPEDWDYADEYVRRHPELLTSWPQLQPAQIRERDRVFSQRLSAEARAACDRGEHELALAMIEDAEWWAPRPGADRIRDFIRSQMTSARQDAEAGSEPPERSADAASADALPRILGEHSPDQPIDLAL